jgi:hypothetical protein
MRTLVVILAIALAGCGDDDGGSNNQNNDNGNQTPIYGCDVRTAATPQGYCQELEGLDSPALLDPYQSGCTGDWIVGACPRTDSLGGCRGEPTMGITITNWFYPFAGGYQTVADVQAVCVSPDTYLAP